MSMQIFGCATRDAKRLISSAISFTELPPGDVSLTETAGCRFGVSIVGAGSVGSGVDGRLASVGGDGWTGESAGPTEHCDGLVAAVGTGDTAAD